MKYQKTRLSILFLILNLFVLFSSALFIEEVYRLQFSDSEYFKNKALSYREKTEVIEARRGSILDRNFNQVAESINAFNIGINPNKITNKKVVSDILSPLLSIDNEIIFKRLNENNNYFYLKRNISFDVGMKIKKWGYQGINVEPSNKRIIYSESLDKIIGHVDPDGNGVEGLELYFDNNLKGINGELTYEAAPNGSVIPQGEIKTIDPIHGEDLLLSLDSDLQYLSEELCEKAINKTDAFKCSVVFANAESGEIII